MCWRRSTPTALSFVVSTVEQPAASAATAREIRSLRFISTSIDSSQPFPFQGIGKKEARCGRRRRHGERHPGPGRFPGPSRGDCAEGSAGAVADARKQALAARLRLRRKNAVHRRDGGSMEGAECGGVKNLRCKKDHEPVGGPTDGEKTQHPARGARHEDRGERESPKKRRQEKEDADFAEDAQHPQKSDERSVVSQVLQVQREKRVQRAVSHSHAERGG